MEEYEAFEPKLSKYNAAIAQLYRLDKLWQDANKHSRSGNLLLWNYDLDCIWRELAPDAPYPKKEEKSYEQKINSINKNLVETNLFNLNEIHPWQINNEKKIENSKIYGILMIKEILLRFLQNAEKKGTAYEDSIDNYMD